MTNDLFGPTDTKTLAEALYVRGIVRTGAATPEALHELQERCVKSALTFAHSYNAGAGCPSCVEVKNLADNERRIFAAQDKLEDGAAKRLAELLDEARKRVKNGLADLPAGSRSAPLYQQVLGAATDALGRVRVGMTDALAGNARDAMALGVDLAEMLLPEGEAALPFRFGDELLRNIATYHADLVTGLTDAVRSAVTREVGLGILAGTDGRAIVKQLVEAGVDATGPFKTAEQRADVIARTEINRVGNIATFDRYTDAATRIATLEKSWLTAGDLRVRSSHRALNGVTLPMDGEFNVGGTKAPYPMWAGLPASESISCRCRLRVKQKADAE
jgi:hypothetical protein